MTPADGLARLLATVSMIMRINVIGFVASTVSSALLAVREEESRAARPTSVVEELELLVALRDRGALTDDEYTLGKRRVFGE